MSNLPELPSKYRSWVEFYQEIEAYAKSQGVCYVSDELEVEIAWEEDSRIDDERYWETMRRRFGATIGGRIRIKMLDVKMEIFEQSMEVFRQRQTLQSLESAVRWHVPPSAPEYASFCRTLSFINTLT